MSDTFASTDADGVEDFRAETAVVGGAVRLTLHGELDFSMLDQLDVALDATPLAGTAFLQLDVSQLAFVDTAAVRRLAAFAATTRATGHDVKTFGANRTFRKVAGVLHVQDDLGLT